MKYRINAYFATLILTLFGAGASLIIVHVATNNQFTVLTSTNDAQYASLKDALLHDTPARATTTAPTR